MIRPAPAAVAIQYPSSDHKPMAENDAQRNAILCGIGALSPPLPATVGTCTCRETFLIYYQGAGTFQA